MLRMSVDQPFSEIKQGVDRLVREVVILPMETEDGGKEWRFAPKESDESEVSRLIALLDDWESREREALLSALPARSQEIVELLRIVRSKISLNKNNRHFMGYVREGAPLQAGRDFFVTTFVRTLDHLEGIWRSVASTDPSSSAVLTEPEGG